MRKTYLLLLVAPSALVWACGGSGDDNLAGDGGPDATSDTTTQPDTSTGDAANDTSTATDGGTTDAANDVQISISCVQPAGCFDGGDPDAAYPPEAGEVCCGTITTTGTTQCTFTSAVTTCDAPATCPTKFNAQGCGTDTVRLCKFDSECTEKSANVADNYTQCCSAAYGDAGRVHFCASDLVAQFSQGVVTCP